MGLSPVDQAELDRFNARASDHPDPTDQSPLKKDEWVVESFRSLRGDNDRPFRGEEVIEGLLRVGEVMILVSNSKAGKSWMAHQIAWSIATGSEFLGMRTKKGKVLIIDTELKSGDMDFRLTEVAKALNVMRHEEDQIDVVRRRGLFGSIYELSSFMSGFDTSGYSLIVIDSLYKMLPPKTSENDNAEMGAMMNVIQGIADRSNVPVLVVHHAPKGDTSSRSAIDVTSGAGAFGRSMDAQITIRPHADDEYCVCDFTARTNPPKPTCTVSFDWPLWRVEDDIAPELATWQGKKAAKQEGDDEVGMQDIFDAIPQDDMIQQAELTRRSGIKGKGRFKRLAGKMVDSGRIKRRIIGNSIEYSRVV